MRKAEVDHAWDECRSDQRRHLAVSRIIVERADGIFELEITSRVGALIGINGAGKTGLLRNLRLVLAGETQTDPRFPVRVLGTFRGADFDLGPAAGDVPEGLCVEFIDASMDIHIIQEKILSQANFDELVEQAGFSEVSEMLVGFLRYICGRRYDRLRIAEVEAPTPHADSTYQSGTLDIEDDVLPFFKVHIEDVSYDSRAMGFGELCACYLIWRLHRAKKGSVILLDEPDSHLSPRAKSALIDLFAVLAHERELWVFFASHSVQSLQALREPDICLVYGDATTMQSSLAVASNRRRVIRTLGLEPAARLLIVVEDVDAREVVVQLINRLGIDFADSVDVQVVTGGAEVVAQFVSRFPKSSRICEAIGILDGDKRAAYSGQAGIYFLPGLGDPIAEARRFVSGNPEAFAEHLSVDVARLRQALAAINHVDHHDFCMELVPALGMMGTPVHAVRSALVRAWFNDPTMEEQARELAGALTAKIDSIAIIPLP